MIGVRPTSWLSTNTRAPPGLLLTCSMSGPGANSVAQPEVRAIRDSPMVRRRPDELCGVGRFMDAHDPHHASLRQAQCVVASNIFKPANPRYLVSLRERATAQARYTDGRRR